MENLAMLAKVIAAHNNQCLEGRIRFQKTIFLLKHLGLPFREKYTYLLYGPYSEEVFYEIKELVRYKLVEETGGPPIGPYYYRLKPEGKKFLKSFPEDYELDIKIKRYVEIISKHDQRALEFLSTFYFIKNTGLAKDSWAKLKELKPERVTDVLVAEAKSLQQELSQAF